MIPTSAQPIETVYKNCRFRSRLEARWAVVFDALGLQWDYEPEGFELPCGRYLPDFYIRDWRIYVEIKAKDSALGADGEKLIQFSVHKEALMLLRGTPGEHEAILFCHLGEPSSSPVGAHVTIVNFNGEVALLSPHSERVVRPNGSVLDCLRFKPSITECVDALAAGRSARFEFGESGVRS